jgi:phosphate/sulfate permease
MGLKGMVISGISIVTGAIMYWATTAQSSAVVQSHGFRLSTVGAILIFAGVAGFLVSIGVYASSRRSPAPAPRTMDRQVSDESGHQSSVHEERR